MTVLSHAATRKHYPACGQHFGTLTRCSADRKLGHFQTEGQISGVGGVEVHMTLEDFVTSAFICDFAVHLHTVASGIHRVAIHELLLAQCQQLSSSNRPSTLERPRCLKKKKNPTPLSSVSAPSDDASVNAAQIVNKGVKSDVLHNAAMAEN